MTTAPPRRKFPRWPVARWALRSVGHLGCAAALAGVGFLAADAVVDRWGQAARRDSLVTLVNSAAYQSASGKRDTLYLATLVEEIHATHDSPFQATRLRWQPLVYWRVRPFTGELIQIDAAGLRRTLHAQPTGPPRNSTPLRIFCFGGSTLWGACVSDAATIPSQLARQLAESGWQVKVTNFAQPGYVSTQERITLEQELARGNLPDVTLFYDGFNDIGAAMAYPEPGLPADEFERPQRELLWQRPTLRTLAGHYFRSSALARVWQPAWQEQLRRRIEQNLAQRTAGRVAAETVDRYLRNLRIVHALGRLGFETRFYWQPLVYSRAHPSADEQAFLQANAAARDYHRMVYRLMAHAVDRFRSDDPLREPFRDLSQVLDDSAWQGSTLFFDACHLADRGNAAVARAMARDLEPLLLQRTTGRMGAAR